MRSGIDVELRAKFEDAAFDVTPVELLATAQAYHETMDVNSDRGIKPAF
jgi:hypothetical protein